MATLKSRHSLRPMSSELRLLRTPEPPYYAVISTNIHHGNDIDIYNNQLKKVLEIANQLDGYLGMEVAKEVLDNNTLYTVATLYFQTLESIESWRKHPKHVAAKKGAKQRWFLEHNIRVCQVLEHYGSNLTHD